jgi:hypothetical protein
MVLRLRWHICHALRSALAMRRACNHTAM